MLLRHCVTCAVRPGIMDVRAVKCLVTHPDRTTETVMLRDCCKPLSNVTIAPMISLNVVSLAMKMYVADLFLASSRAEG